MKFQEKHNNRIIRKQIIRFVLENKICSHFTVLSFIIFGLVHWNYPNGSMTNTKRKTKQNKTK